ncbi:MAG: acyl-CoA dehydrogenase family protein [Labilibaculum sp.]|nr:acyl-CoA dehydrogenase family protein [Labilibaculum sp.]MBI9057748.1 acyl-CoA dehydrogenase family protein [Labilibaculum sp.]|eukprot:TRINITY_DN7771_c0_g11_i1.p1 TRINITY_DN7771_c0_g11~~TRINITY_DN7771_c0_g11_i1.p1  ORF type:complete len:383 (+),score=63.23 TRINITY_DN7771_c0_g11_i1:258-1406(+)
MRNPYIRENHNRIREKVKEFAEKEVRPLAFELDEKEEFSTHLTKRMGELGLFGIYLPKKYGGQQTDYLSLLIAIEEIAKVDASQASTLAAHNSLGIGPIYYFGTEDQKEKYLPQLTTGNFVWAFGLTEDNAGSDSRGTESTGDLLDDNWIINGSKKFISNASSNSSLGVSLQVVTANDNGKKELSAILVERSTEGFEAEPIKRKMMWRASDTAQLNFTNCKVPKQNLLGNLGEGSRIMLQTLDSGRLTIAAMGLGLAQGAYELALSYSKKREQFGKPISKFQAISFKLADMATKIEAARNLLYHACWLKDNGHEFGKEAAMAKLYCSEIAQEIANEAVQIHGAHGLIKESEVERFYRDQRILQIGEGTSEILKLVISRHIGC